MNEWLLVLWFGAVAPGMTTVPNIASENACTELGARVIMGNTSVKATCYPYQTSVYTGTVKSGNGEKGVISRGLSPGISPSFPTVTIEEGQPVIIKRKAPNGR